MNDGITDEAIARRIAERNELTRIAAKRILDNHEMGLKIADEQTLVWARAFVRMHKPLKGALGTGEPTVLADALPMEPVASFLNRWTRVMRGAGDVVRSAK